MSSLTDRTTRVPYQREVVVFCGSARLRGAARNISTKGMLVEVPTTVVPSPYVRLQLQLGDSGPWIQTDALRTRRLPRGDHELWETRFVETPASARVQLERYVKQQRGLAEIRDPGDQAETSVARRRPSARRPRRRPRIRPRRRRDPPAHRRSRPPRHKRPARADADHTIQQLYEEAVDDVEDDGLDIDIVRGRPLV